jgi:hypothetical protein
MGNACLANPKLQILHLLVAKTDSHIAAGNLFAGLFGNSVKGQLDRPALNGRHSAILPHRTQPHGLRPPEPASHARLAQATPESALTNAPDPTPQRLRHPIAAASG